MVSLQPTSKFEKETSQREKEGLTGGPRMKMKDEIKIGRTDGKQTKEESKQVGIDKQAKQARE